MSSLRLTPLLIVIPAKAGTQVTFALYLTMALNVTG